MVKKTLEELFKDWQEKNRHQGKLFNRDGIIDENEWNNLPQNKRILFLLKEAYHKNEDDELLQNQYYDLANDLKKNGPWKMWYKVVDWIYAILNTTETKLADYEACSKVSSNNEILRKAAVVNIKKSGGKSHSNYEELRNYVAADREELLEEIKLINPGVIICGYTSSLFKEIVGKENITEESKNWYYFWGDTLVIDYYHPANQYPALVNFYAVASIYQKALLSKQSKQGEIDMANRKIEVSNIGVVDKHIETVRQSMKETTMRLKDLLNQNPERDFYEMKFGKIG